jgi:hypothetical protein
VNDTVALSILPQGIYHIHYRIRRSLLVQDRVPGSVSVNAKEKAKVGVHLDRESSSFPFGTSHLINSTMPL